MNVLTVALFTASDANYASVLPLYLSTANTLLKPHNMVMEVFPTNPGDKNAPRTLPFTGAAYDGPGDPGTLRAMAHRAVPVGRGIPVIFCKRNDDDTTTDSGKEGGSTILPENMETNNGIWWLPYILINTQTKSLSGETLLHEMIHAAYGKIVRHDPSPKSVFYATGTTAASGERTRALSAPYADVLRKAYFASFAP